MRRALIISFISLLPLAVKAQDIEFGINSGTHLMYFVKYDSSYFYPSNSYQGYYSGAANKPLIRKVSSLNSFHLGATINGTHKRFGFTLEPQFFFQRLSFKFDHPVQVRRVIGRKAFRMPMFLRYNLVPKKHGPFFMLGLIFHKENNFDFQSPGPDVYLNAQPLSTVAVDFGDNHFYRVMYTEKAYFSYVFGLGVTTRKGVAFSVRTHRRLINSVNRGISANIWNTEFSVNFPIVAISEITNKHFIYVD